MAIEEGELILRLRLDSDEYFADVRRAKAAKDEIAKPITTRSTGKNPAVEAAREQAKAARDAARLEAQYIRDKARLEREAAASAVRVAREATATRIRLARELAREEREALRSAEQEMRRTARATSSFGDIFKATFASNLLVDFFQSGLAAARAFFTESISAARAGADAMRFLATQTFITGTALEENTKLVEELRTEFGLTRTDAERFVATALTFTKATGKVGETAEFVRAVGDSAVAAGRSLGELRDILEQVQTLQDEGVEKLLGGRQPSQIYDEYAASVGTTAGKLDFAAKRLAVFNEVLRRGELIAGAASDRLKTTAGQLEQAENLMTDLKRSIGEAILSSQVFRDTVAYLAEALKQGTKEGKDFRSVLEGLEPLLRGVGLLAVVVGRVVVQLAISVKAAIDGIVGSLLTLQFLMDQDEIGARAMWEEVKRVAEENEKAYKRAGEVADKFIDILAGLGAPAQKAGEQAGQKFLDGFNNSISLGDFVFTQKTPPPGKQKKEKDPYEDANQLLEQTTAEAIRLNRAMGIVDTTTRKASDTFANMLDYARDLGEEKIKQLNIDIESTVLGERITALTQGNLVLRTELLAAEAKVHVAKQQALEVEKALSEEAHKFELERIRISGVANEEQRAYLEQQLALKQRELDLQTQYGILKGNQFFREERAATILANAARQQNIEAERARVLAEERLEVELDLARAKADFLADQAREIEQHRISLILDEKARSLAQTRLDAQDAFNRALERTGDLVLAIGERMRVFREQGEGITEVTKTFGDFAKEVFFSTDALTHMATAIGTAFAEAITDGENFAKAMLKLMLDLIGDLCIKWGAYHIGLGIANSLNPLTPGSGAGEIAAGTALVALGAALKGFASAINTGGSGGASGGSSGSSGSTSAGGGGVSPRERPVERFAFGTSGEREVIIRFEGRGKEGGVVAAMMAEFEKAGAVTVRTVRRGSTRRRVKRALDR